MKKRLIAIACAVMIVLLPATAEPVTTSTTDVAADAILVRPMCFVATVLGSAVFVVTLPFTAPCGGVHTAADALVVRPAHATFTRDLGDMEALSDE
jgi:hypothetical protein